MEEAGAVQFIRLAQSDEGKTQLEIVNEDVLSRLLLSTAWAGKKICIIAAAGKYRGGKSFRLNCLLGRLKGVEYVGGFASARSDAPVTEGLWLWAEPLTAIIDGEEVGVMLVDTEGSLALDNNKGDSAIFTLAAVLSSLLMLSVQYPVGPDNLQFLHLLTDYGRMVADHGAKDEFQSLLFLIRDTETAEEEEGLEEGTRYVLGNIFNQAEYKSLGESFGQVHGYRLPPPANRRKEDEEFLLHPANEELRSSIGRLAGDVFGGLAKPRLRSGRALNGQSALSLIKTTVEAINSAPELQALSLVESRSRWSARELAKEVAALHQDVLAHLEPSLNLQELASELLRLRFNAQQMFNTAPRLQCSEEIYAEEEAELLKALRSQSREAAEASGRWHREERGRQSALVARLADHCRQRLNKENFASQSRLESSFVFWSRVAVGRLQTEAKPWPLGGARVELERELGRLWAELSGRAYKAILDGQASDGDLVEALFLQASDTLAEGCPAGDHGERAWERSVREEAEARLVSEAKGEAAPLLAAFRQRLDRDLELGRARERDDVLHALRVYTDGMDKFAEENHTRSKNWQERWETHLDHKGRAEARLKELTGDTRRLGGRMERLTAETDRLWLNYDRQTNSAYGRLKNTLFKF